MILWYPSSVRILIILGNLMIHGQISKVQLGRFVRVPRGSSVRILYPRESYDSWEAP
jgi:hypothetical protein